MLAGGAYIRAVRDARDMSRAQVYQLTKVHESQIARIEAGTQDAGYTSVLAIVKAVRGDVVDFYQLVTNPRAKVEDATALADRLVSSSAPSSDPELDAILAEEYERKQGHGPERVRAAHVLEDLIEYPDLLEQWLVYGEFLLNRRLP